MFPFQKKKVAPQRPLATHRMGYNLTYWRSRPDLVDWAKATFKTPEFQAFLSVLHAETPKGYTENPALQLGRINGWTECLLCIAAMAEHPQVVSDEVPATFGAHHDFPELLTNEPQPQE